METEGKCVLERKEEENKRKKAHFGHEGSEFLLLRSEIDAIFERLIRLLLCCMAFVLK